MTLSTLTEKILISKKTGGLLLLSTAIIMIIIGWMQAPIPQPKSYHNFADDRTFFGIANASNVLTNLPFVLTGLWGLFLLFSKKIVFIDNKERGLCFTLSIGLVLVGFGSAYYHLDPDNSRLVWDRLPMAIVFMSFVATLICDRINVRLGFYLWPFLVIIGISSVLQWHISEVNGVGDLRFYFGVQAYTALAAIIMLALPSGYTRREDIILVVVFYALAKLFELFDNQIFMYTHGILSGHALKHIAAALAGFYIIRMIWKREIQEI